MRTEQLASGETPGRGIARLIKSGAIFAVLAPDVAGDERGVVAAADADGMPVIGPLTPGTHVAPRSRYVFYLGGGIEAEARALAGFAATLPGSPLIVDDSTSPELLRPENFAGVAGPVLWLAGRALDRNDFGSQVELLVPGTLATEALTHSASAQTWIAFATGQPNVPQDATTEYRELDSRRGQPATDGASQRQALAAAKILIEALRRAGRDVIRERLVEALETLQDFHTGLIPPVSYSATRRIGSDGAWIVPLAGGEPIWWDR